ncbi:inactive peptidyl-prolyl cis-trans isomerase shutdown-like [Colias croceus]|uniref:inactive peptidyl-prolyl cis-trans isomerase shutdown-like n=1 Tax=Colias crocea TaxID=72248 RepID=UPI001E280D52|nr:inactive peptidyl-prolyl cis-trans isomerase shutdown-like [Colias croceus]XP_045509094.1 inactive peptidyl-prolyl cis-trans isomerase shutdown-like [Colias croceus]
MENILEDPVQLSKGINLHELLTTSTEFSIDVDFKKSDLTIDREFFDDLEDDSDTEDVLQYIEESASKMMLSCPEYHSFSDLSTKMIDCVSSGDVKMLILEEGDGPIIPVDAEVTIHYAAYWEKDKIPFDSTLTMNNGVPMRIKLGKGSCIPGLEIGLTMVRGPKARFLLLIQPALAWGPQGVLPRVRPEAALFTIELYSVNDLQAPIRFNDLPSEEQSKFEVTTRTVNSLHAQAKDFFAKRKFNKCIKNYQQSMYVLNLSVVKNATEEAEVKRLKINTYVNLAVCYYKINKPKYVINMCENLDFVTDINKHCKALFYYGRAYEMLGKTEDALKYYKLALKLEPKNRDIGKALANLDKYNKKSAENEKELWQNALRSVPEKKKVVYDVDSDFLNTVRDMCQDLAGSDEYTKFELPNSFTSNEVNCIKDLCSEFEGLIVQEDGEGKKKKVFIIRKDAS